MRKAQMRWAQMRWDEMKCGVWSASVKCGVRGVKSAVRSVKKVFAWRCIAPGSCSGHVLGQQRNSFAQSTRARAWLAHGAWKFYRWERSYNVSLRQLPPRLVRVLLVFRRIYRTWNQVAILLDYNLARQIRQVGSEPRSWWSFWSSTSDRNKMNRGSTESLTLEPLTTMKHASRETLGMPYSRWLSETRSGESGESGDNFCTGSETAGVWHSLKQLGFKAPGKEERIEQM